MDLIPKETHHILYIYGIFVCGNIFYLRTGTSEIVARLERSSERPR